LTFFSISSIYTCQKIVKIFVVFHFMDYRFIKEFWKILDFFKKKS